jgi:hypothetical protein
MKIRPAPSIPAAKLVLPAILTLVTSDAPSGRKCVNSAGGAPGL